MPDPEAGKAAADASTLAAAAREYDDLADKLRTRAGFFGKSLAGIASLGTGAVGLKTVSDLAPQEGTLRYWLCAIAAMLGLLAAAAGAVYVAISLMQVDEPLVLDVDDPEDGLETDGEKSVASRIYRVAARRYGMSSIQGLQERQRALRKAASRASTDDERARRTALADEAQGVIDHAVARAQLAVVRRRIREAVSGDSAKVAYGSVAAGLLLFAFLSDVATSRQSDSIDTAKACAEARDKGAVGHDFDDTRCDPSAKSDDKSDAGSTPPPSTEAESRAALIAKLVEGLANCTTHQVAASAPEDKARTLDTSDCAAVTEAISKLLVKFAPPSEPPPTTTPSATPTGGASGAPQ